MNLWRLPLLEFLPFETSTLENDVLVAEKVLTQETTSDVDFSLEAISEIKSNHKEIEREVSACLEDVIAYLPEANTFVNPMDDLYVFGAEKVLTQETTSDVDFSFEVLDTAMKEETSLSFN